jgi:hypothetical protein
MALTAPNCPVAGTLPAEVERKAARMLLGLDDIIPLSLADLGDGQALVLARQTDAQQAAQTVFFVGAEFHGGGRAKDFCHEHAGQIQVCTRSVDCSVRSLWHAVQSVVDDVLGKTTLQDLLRSEGEMNSWVKTIPTNTQLTFLQ